MLAASLPMVALSLVAAWSIYVGERRAVTAGAMETARALSLVVDREIAYRAGILSTLAASPAFDRQDWAAFYEQAKGLTPSGENTIVLMEPDGRQLVNTRVPLGTQPLPQTKVATHGTDDALRVSVSDLYFAPIGRAYSFAVRVPVLRDGQARYYVSMGSYAMQLQRIFEQQPLPEGWTGTLVDARGAVVARNLQPEQRIGQFATPDMQARMRAAPQGLHETKTLDGTPVYTVFARAPESGWTILIGLPKAALGAGALTALGWMLLLSLALVALGVWAAVRAGRNIAAPVAQLQTDALALGRGEPIAEVRTGLKEADVVQRLLVHASMELRAADQRLHERVRSAVADTERAQRVVLDAQRLEALGRLTGGIAHDFNNLLQTMTTGVALAAKLVADPKAQQALASCERAVDRAVKLTRQLLTFGRSQPGHRSVLALQRRLPELDELLRGALRESIALHIEVDDDVAPVEADPVQLELALLNLALNARDALAGAPGLLRVHACNRRVEHDTPLLVAGDYVEIGVEDNGPGIAPDVLPRVFEPFFTTKPVGQGSGLGLAQVYGFARQLGGAAFVSSAPSGGTRVSVWLPASRTVAEPPATPAPAPHERYAGTVLLVEDDALVRGTTAAALESRGYAVLVASGAQDALAIAAAREDIDVVLSDIMMAGGRSGLDLVDALRRSRPALPVVLATGYADAMPRQTRVPVIAKPYDVDQVAVLLHRLIARVPDGTIPA